MEEPRYRVRDGAELSAQGLAWNRPKSKGASVRGGAAGRCVLYKRVLPSTRLELLLPAFSTRVLPAQATGIIAFKCPRMVSHLSSPKGTHPLTHDHCSAPARTHSEN